MFCPLIIFVTAVTVWACRRSASLFVIRLNTLTIMQPFQSGGSPMLLRCPTSVKKRSSDYRRRRRTFWVVRGGKH